MPLPKVVVVAVPQGAKGSNVWLHMIRALLRDYYPKASIRLLDLEAMYHPKAEHGSVNSGYNAALRDIAGQDT